MTLLGQGPLRALAAAPLGQQRLRARAATLGQGPPRARTEWFLTLSFASLYEVRSPLGGPVPAPAPVVPAPVPVQLHVQQQQRPKIVLKQYTGKTCHSAAFRFTVQEAIRTKEEACYSLLGVLQGDAQQVVTWLVRRQKLRTYDNLDQILSDIFIEKKSQRGRATGRALGVQKAQNSSAC